MGERLLLFDLDNTLIDRAGGFTTWARAFASRRSLRGESEVAEAVAEIVARTA
jgi:phosphoserine phosphatase